MFTYRITVRDKATAHLIEEDRAQGNTWRAARVAAEALALQLEGFYPGAVVEIVRAR